MSSFIFCLFYRLSPLIVLLLVVCRSAVCAWQNKRVHKIQYLNADVHYKSTRDISDQQINKFLS